MFKYIKKTLIFSAVSLLATGALVACQPKSVSEGSSSTQVQSEASKVDIHIKHAFGETEIKEVPQKVATIAWGNHDVPLALGIVPVGVSKANFGVKEGENLLPWTKAAFEKLGEKNPNVYDDVDGLNFEAISDSHPDVILAAYSGISEEDYKTLSEIAPVVAYPGLAWQTGWREQTLIQSEALGKKAEGEALVKEAEALIQEKVKEYGVEGKKAAFIFVSPTDLSQVYIYLPTDTRAAYLQDLGLEISESVKKLAGESKEFYILVSAEEINKLDDIDLLVTYGDAALLESLQKDKLLSTLPAIKDGRVVLLDGTSALAASCTPSILSIPATIDEYLGLIKEALNK